MKKIGIIVLLAFSVAAKAQVTKVSLQASGLTCSMCSNAINKSLRTLDFVSAVDADIKNSIFLISFKPGAAVNFDQLKKKVEDAGFFVARLIATVNFDQLAIANDAHVSLGNDVFHFLNVKDQTLSGMRDLRLLDKGFVPDKEYKKNSAFTKMPCYKSGEDNGRRIFHVTM